MKKNKKFDIKDGIVIMFAVIFALKLEKHLHKSLGLSYFEHTIVGILITGIIAGMGIFLVNYFSKKLKQKK